MSVCDRGFLAFSPQRFAQERKFDASEFQLLGVPGHGSEGVWMYESRENPGEPVTVSSWEGRREEVIY